MCDSKKVGCQVDFIIRLRHLAVDIWKEVCGGTAGRRSKGCERHSLVSFSCRSVVQFESLFAGDLILKVTFLLLRLHLATIFNNAGVALAVLRHCVPGNTCSGISRCDDWQTQTGPLCIHWGILKTKIQGHLTSVASPLQNTRPMNGKLKRTK